MEVARLSISFKERQFITSRRSELHVYSETDFLANCGGLLGLFMGVSLLSIVEFIYYCTLRLCCTLRMHRLRENRIADVDDVEPISVIAVDLDDQKRSEEKFKIK